VDLRHIPLRRPRAGRIEKLLDRAALGLFALSWLVAWLRFVLAEPPLVQARWPEAVLLLTAAASTLASLARQLPLQNVILAAAVVALLGGIFHTLGAVTAVPFGPLEFQPSFGRLLFPPLPWAVPLLWIVLVLNARGVGRIILRPWRQTRDYGLWLIGVSAVLTGMLELALEPFATGIMHYWSWGPTKLASSWYGTPWVNLLGWVLCTLLVLAFVTPALINKRPGGTEPQWQPWLVWSLLNLLLLTGLSAGRLWLAVLVAAGNIVVVAGLVLFAWMKVRCSSFSSSVS
jgi:uncharacterized membrane protein